ncbi:MAG: hypothetical protein KAR31_07775 [Candidatus Omnitrophica bacterium]|nr:hypothetical protein [Candidatus Omnitrophota bacterium]MCK5179690.1 hypothetical protein [Candidatus Omnitrophota bacterium]MCK5259902.1 hypothetical protein [Candidatus Omnitrophota bacterium]
MKKGVVLIGVGEMGGVFARGFLKSEYPVYPVEQGTGLNSVYNEMSDPLAVIVGVAEKDLHSVLEAIPQGWRDRLILLQNELLPRDWQAHNIENPTVISMWSEKKKGQDVKVIIPSPVFGPHAGLVKESLNAIDIDCTVVADEDAMLFELVVKNVYILTVNIAGLKVGGTVGELWGQHQEFAREVAEDIMDIQFRLIGKELDRQKLIECMVQAFNGDLDHKCMGRSAPARLQRALSQADEFGLQAEALKEISTRKDQTAVS